MNDPTATPPAERARRTAEYVAATVPVAPPLADPLDGLREHLRAEGYEGPFVDGAAPCKGEPEDGDNCGNPLHPDGPWHPAAAVPGSWQYRARLAQWARRRAWGCGCGARHARPVEEVGPFAVMVGCQGGGAPLVDDAGFSTVGEDGKPVRWAGVMVRRPVRSDRHVLRPNRKAPPSPGLIVGVRVGDRPPPWWAHPGSTASRLRAARFRLLVRLGLREPPAPMTAGSSFPDLDGIHGHEDLAPGHCPETVAHDPHPWETAGDWPARFLCNGAGVERPPFDVAAVEAMATRIAEDLTGDLREQLRAAGIEHPERYRLQWGDDAPAPDCPLGPAPSCPPVEATVIRGGTVAGNPWRIAGPHVHVVTHAGFDDYHPGATPEECALPPCSPVVEARGPACAPPTDLYDDPARPLDPDNVDAIGRAFAAHRGAEARRAILGHVLRDTPAGPVDEVAPVLLDRLEALGFTVDTVDRSPTLGGRVPGTGAWVVDDLGYSGPAVTAEGVKWRPALRDPDGGAWCSWLTLPPLDGLREQLAAGARAMAADLDPTALQLAVTGLQWAGNPHALLDALAEPGTPIERPLVEQVAKVIREAWRAAYPDRVEGGPIPAEEAAVVQVAPRAIADRPQA